MAKNFWLSIFMATMATVASFGSAAHAYNRVGVIDRHGNTVIPCIYHRVEPLSNGFFFLEEMDPEHPLKWSYNGHVVTNSGLPVSVKTPAGCTLSEVFLPESARVNGSATQLPEDTILEIHGATGFGLMRMNGKIILEPVFESISTPIEGVFPVSKGRPFVRKILMFMFNSKTGERVKAPEHATPPAPAKYPPLQFQVFQDGRDIYGYMSTTGQVVIQPQFHRAGPFAANGLARVSFKRTRDDAFINKRGEVVSPVFESASDFFNNIAVVRKAGRLGLIDQHFNFVMQPEYLHLEHLFDDVYAVQKNDSESWQAITASGKVLFSLPDGTRGICPYTNEILCHVINPAGGTEPLSVFIDHAGSVLETRMGRKTICKSNRAQQYQFGLAAVLAEEKLNCKKWKLIDSSGTVIQPAQSAFFEIVASDRILKYVPVNHFNPAIWKNPDPMGDGAGLNRTDCFANFLRDFDFIGMPRSDVERWLGTPDRATKGGCFYYIAYPPCFSGSTGIDIEYQNERVSRWREDDNCGGVQREFPWVTTNMIVDPNYEELGRVCSEPVLHLVPKGGLNTTKGNIEPSRLSSKSWSGG